MKKYMCALMLSIGISQANQQMVDFDTCYTPAMNCTQMIVNQINLAKNSIDVQAYDFSSKPIIDALVQAHSRGVIVRVVLDKSNQFKVYSGLNAMMVNHVPVYIDNKPKIAHNKVMIIDSNEVITGSFNFTASAQKANAENLIVLRNHDLASSYEINFMLRLNQSINCDSQVCKVKN